MNFFAESFRIAIALIVSGDSEVIAAVTTSLGIAVWSVLFASVLGVPAGMTVALGRIPMKGVVRLWMNSMMAMPTVVIGLLAYGLLSRQGPLGSLGWLFTPKAIILGETVLATPVISNYAMIAIQEANEAILSTAKTLSAGNLQCLFELMRETRFGIAAAIIAGFGRVVSEVGSHDAGRKYPPVYAHHDHRHCAGER